MGRILERLRIQWNEYFEMYSGTIENSMKLKYFEMNFWKKLRIWWRFSILVWIFGRNWKFDAGLLFWNKILREIRNRKYYWFSRTCWPAGTFTRGGRAMVRNPGTGRGAWSRGGPWSANLRCHIGVRRRMHAHPHWMGCEGWCAFSLR